MGWRQSYRPLLVSKQDMKHFLLTTIAAVLLAGCGEPQQSANPVAHQSDPISEVDSALLDAAKEGNIEAVKQHLANGADVNAKDDGWTPLHNAAGYSTKEMVELLISNGANVNVKNEDEWTPLHDAASKEVAELLIAKGADMDAKDKDNWTPLHKAAFGGHMEIVELLIAEGADVNAKGEDEWTPLNLTQDPETIDLLRKHGGKTKNELEAEAKK